MSGMGIRCLGGGVLNGNETEQNQNNGGYVYIYFSFYVKKLADNCLVRFSRSSLEVR